LIAISKLESQRALTEEESARKADFVARRTQARDALLESFARGQLYFTEAACGTISAFRKWDDAQATKSLDNLPDIEEWCQWEAKVLAQLKRDERVGGSWPR
jgi:hypothetical protein